MRNPYTVLGLTPDADRDAVKAAYRRLAKAFHPDHNADDFGAQELFAEINAAYQILGDDHKRMLFDQGHINALGRRIVRKRMDDTVSAGGAAVHGMGKQARPEDIISSIFGEAEQPKPAPQARRQKVDATPGLDDVPVNQASVERGPRDNTGRDGASRNRIWPLLNPASWPILNIFSRRTDEDSAERASVLADLALDIEMLADAGRHEMTLDDGRTVEITIPRGTLNGDILHLPSQRDGSAGDVFVAIRLKPHPTLRAEGYDLHTSLPVTLEDAVFGTRQRVATLNGDMEIVVPAWSDCSRTIRIA
jgi:DnaJ-class molecular chaperone